jgi:hypothetical protein
MRQVIQDAVVLFQTIMLPEQINLALFYIAVLPFEL